MKKLILISFLLFLFSCKGRIESGAGGGTEKPFGNADTTALNGTWISQCTDFGGNNSSATTMSFNNGEVTADGAIYASNNCSGTMVSKLSQAMSVVVSGTSPLGADIYNLDGVMGTATMTVYLQSQVDLFNQMSYCGFNNWSVAKAKVVSNTSCHDAKMNPGVRSYSIGRYTGNTLQTGQSDMTNDGTTPEKRHTQLHPTIFSR